MDLEALRKEKVKAVESALDAAKQSFIDLLECGGYLEPNEELADKSLRVAVKYMADLRKARELPTMKATHYFKLRMFSEKYLELKKEVDRLGLTYAIRGTHTRFYSEVPDPYYEVIQVAAYTHEQKVVWSGKAYCKREAKCKYFQSLIDSVKGKG